MTKTLSKHANIEKLECITTNYASSLAYLKRTTAVAVSYILYMRDIFDEKSYGHRKLGDQKLRILSNNGCDGAKSVVKMLHGCFDAIEKRYLKQMVMGFYEHPNQSDHFSEAYIFQFQYKDGDNVQMDVSLKNKSIISKQHSEVINLESETRALTRRIYSICGCLKPLPSQCFLTIKLYYYDDTPVEYEPPGFVPAKCDKFFINGESQHINVGSVESKFHGLTLKIKAKTEAFENVGLDQTQSQIKNVAECGAGDGFILLNHNRSPSIDSHFDDEPMDMDCENSRVKSNGDSRNDKTNSDNYTMIERITDKTQKLSFDMPKMSSAHETSAPKKANVESFEFDFTDSQEKSRTTLGQKRLGKKRGIKSSDVLKPVTLPKKKYKKY